MHDITTGLLAQMRSNLEQECSIKVLAERQAHLDKQQSLMQQIQSLEMQLSHGTLYCIICTVVCIHVYVIPHLTDDIST